jgi:hypothetical protein
LERLEAGAVIYCPRFFHFELEPMSYKLVLFMVTLLLGCSEGTVMRFAAGSVLLLEHDEKDLGRGLDAKAELVRSQLLPLSLQNAILNKAVVDASHSPCIAICLNTTETRAEMLDELQADTSIIMIRQWEFPHTTDIQALEYLRNGTVMRSYLFLEPGSGLLIVLSTSGQHKDETWFRRSVQLPRS